MLRFSSSHRSIRAITSISNPSSFRPFSSFSSSPSSFLGLRPLPPSSQSILALSIATAFALTLTSTVAFSDASLSPPAEETSSSTPTPKLQPSQPNPNPPTPPTPPIVDDDRPPLSTTDFSDLDSEPDSETDCSFCQTMRSSPCANFFRRWERCVAKHKTEEDPEGFITACTRETAGLGGCMDGEEYGVFMGELKERLDLEMGEELEENRRIEEGKRMQAGGEGEVKIEEVVVEAIETVDAPIPTVEKELAVESLTVAEELDLPPLSTTDFSDLDGIPDVETDCSFCHAMRASPCANPFRRWERCMDRYKGNGEEDDDEEKERKAEECKRMCARENEATSECIQVNFKHFASKWAKEKEDAIAEKNKEEEGSVSEVEETVGDIAIATEEKEV